MSFFKREPQETLLEGIPETDPEISESRAASSGALTNRIVNVESVDEGVEFGGFTGRGRSTASASEGSEVVVEFLRSRRYAWIGTGLRWKFVGGIWCRSIPCPRPSIAESERRGHSESESAPELMSEESLVKLGVLCIEEEALGCLLAGDVQAVVVELRQTEDRRLTRPWTLDRELD